MSACKEADGFAAVGAADTGADIGSNGCPFGGMGFAASSLEKTLENAEYREFMEKKRRCAEAGPLRCFSVARGPSPAQLARHGGASGAAELRARSPWD